MATAWWRRREARTAGGRAALLLAGTDAPRIAVLAPQDDPGLVQDLQRTLPTARIVEPGADPVEAHLLLTAEGPFDLVVDASPAAGRVRRFWSCLFHLRPGAPYVVPGAAAELGPGSGPLGDLLRSVSSRPEADVRQPALRLAESSARALRSHVVARAEGEDLVLCHDLPDVLVKIREEVLDDFLESYDSEHRVLDVISAAAPEPPVGAAYPAPTGKNVGRPLDAVPLSLREYRDVVVAPFQLVVSGRIALPDSYRRNRDSSPRSNALNSLAPDFAIPTPALPARTSRMAGTFVHLDNEARGHFGHLVVESLAKAWVWDRAVRIDPDVRVLVSATPKRPTLMGYELEIYEAFGIPPDRIVLIDEPTTVERLISGTPMMSNPHYVHPRILETWRRVGDALVAKVPDRPWPARIFVGRRESKRSCIGAEQLEAVFAEHGFVVVHPEEHALGHQVQMFRAAEVVAGYAGSGLFGLAFAERPTRVVQVVSDAYSPRNEYLIAAAHGHRLDSLVCRSVGTGARGNLADFEYDEQRDGPLLRTILATL